MNKLNWQNGNLFEKVKELKKKLDVAQANIDKDPHNIHLRKNGVELLKEYTIALEDEEKLLFQKAKVEWLNEGDINSAFFHKVLKGRVNRSRVEEIYGEDNIRYSGDQVPIHNEACRMIGEITDDEIKAAMFDIDDNKAPGPDGFTAKFFKKAWHIVGSDVCNAVKEFFAHSNVKSIWVIKRALDSFSEMSGLYPNLSKSTIFCGSMKSKDIEEILQILPFKQGKLLVRYLGVPLVSKKIGAKDCKSLIDKVRIKVMDWKNHSLSYAGRAQLIVSVLASIQVYWASVFKLPNMVIKDIERLFKGFLWNKGELQRRKAKVSWKEVCQPKQNGGLGIKPLESWNKILLVKHLWNIAAKKDTLWVQRINMVKMKGRSVWEIDKQSTDSWNWKCLLDLRDEARSHMQFNIGNWKKTSVWHEKWCMEPALDTIISRREVYAVGFTDEDTVADYICENKWRWPQEWYKKYPSLDKYDVPRLDNETSDKLMWISNDGCKKEFASNHVWKDFRQLNRSVKWWKVIWFSQNIPRHAFVLWMAVKGKLVTQDKLAKWYPDRIDKCPLCLKVEDSHKHLFFDCEFSSEVWENIQLLANMKNLKDLDRSTEWIATLPCKNNI
ncbi:RNA-directed DNA polymerase, eukaryota, reverse transcriptase zinc-binding domain protein [Tanacetum coccineum]